MPKKELVDLAVKVLVETDKAWRLTDGAKTEWFPKSQCQLEEGILTCPEWLAKAKGFI